MKFCNQGISKTSIARSFKLGQLIEDNEWINWLNFLKVILFFLSYCPLQIWPLKTCNKDTSKNITASSLKPGQLIEDDE